MLHNNLGYLKKRVEIKEIYHTSPVLCTASKTQFLSALMLLEMYCTLRAASFFKYSWRRIFFLSLHAFFFFFFPPQRLEILCIRSENSVENEAFRSC